MRGKGLRRRKCQEVEGEESRGDSRSRSGGLVQEGSGEGSRKVWVAVKEFNFLRNPLGSLKRAPLKGI